MSDKDYIKEIENQNEELQKKLSQYENNFWLVATTRMSDKFKPELQIHLNTYIRMVSGDKRAGFKIATVNIAIATKKLKYWAVNHNEALTYSFKKDTNNIEEVVDYMLEQAGYIGFKCEIIKS